MSVSDSVADMLTKIRNATRARHGKVDIPASKLKLEIVKILKTEGYIKNFRKVQEEGKNIIRIFLKYDDMNNPVIHGLEKISTPGRRIYSGYKDLPRVHNGYGSVIVSTSSGVTTGKKATEKMVGGELVCKVWSREVKMSKVGKLPVVVPAGVNVTINGNEISVKGPKGELSQTFSPNVEVAFENGEIIVKTKNTSRQANADHGLYRALINNMVTGVSAGFSKSLIITGVGYRAEVKGEELVMNLGYSTDFIAMIPKGLSVATDPNGRVTVSGIDKQQVGEFCAQIRKLRKPEPYKGKGIRYETEIIRRKVGKTGVK